jgi:hypothetical protein
MPKGKVVRKALEEAVRKPRPGVSASKLASNLCGSLSGPSDLATNPKHLANVMRMTLQPIPMLLVLITLLFCGCVRAPGAATLSRLAVAASNQEASRLYHVQPFREEHGQLRAVAGTSVWEGLTSSGGHTLAATVTFNERGAVVSVDVRMIANPISEPRRDIDAPLRRDETPGPQQR